MMVNVYREFHGMISKSIVKIEELSCTPSKKKQAIRTIERTTINYIQNKLHKMARNKVNIWKTWYQRSYIQLNSHALRRAISTYLLKIVETPIFRIDKAKIIKTKSHGDSPHPSGLRMKKSTTRKSWSKRQGVILNFNSAKSAII